MVDGFNTQNTMQQDQSDAEASLDLAVTEKCKEAGAALQQQDLQQQDLQKQDLQKLEQEHQRSQQQAFRFILTQLLTAIILSAILLMFDRVIAYSSLLGGLIATLANAWYAIKVFAVKPTTAEALLTTFYVGEMYKIILTGSMFLMVFVLVAPISGASLLLTYLLIHMTPAVHNVLAKD